MKTGRFVELIVHDVEEYILCQVYNRSGAVCRQRMKAVVSIMVNRSSLPVGNPCILGNLYSCIGCEGSIDAFCESSSRVPSCNYGAYVKAVVMSLASDWLSLKERSMQVIRSGTESMFFHRWCDCHFFHKLVQK